MAFMRDPLYILMQDGVTQIHKDGSRNRLVVNQDLFDDIVMMRYHNMTEEERQMAVDRILEDQFETGADGVRKANGLPTAIERANREGMWMP